MNIYLNLDNARPRMAYAWKLATDLLSLGAKVKVTVSEYKPTRSLAQNDKLNAMCSDVAKQVDWHGLNLSKGDFRHMFVAAYRKEQRVVPGIDGGFVVLGASSRKLNVAECSDVIELINAFGVEHNVIWGD